MNTTSQAPLPGIEEGDLTCRVRRAMGDERLELLSWNCIPLAWKPSNSVTAGVYRVEGIAANAVRNEIPWSFILKIVRPIETTSDPSHYSYWKREVLAYRSGFLENLPSPVRAPKCFEIEEQEDGTVWLWLEEIHTIRPGDWTPSDHATAAYALGRFNGVYLSGRSIPAEPWLAVNWLQSWVAECDKFAQIAATDQAWLDPPVRWVFPESERYFNFLHHREVLLAGIQRLPKVVCHNDAWPPNLFRSSNSEWIAIDWAFVGIAGVGEELGRFFGLTVKSDLSGQAQKSVLFDHYLCGLRDSGWGGDARLARYGFAASAALRLGMVVPKILHRVLDEERNQGWGRGSETPTSDDLQRLIQIAYLLFELFDEALGLVEAI